MSLIVLTVTFSLLRIASVSQLNILQGKKRGENLHILLSKLGISRSKLSEISGQLLKYVFHMEVAVVHPNPVIVTDLHLFLLFSRSTRIDNSLVCHFVTIIDAKQVMSHSLIGKFMN